jgi:hypothetical protein
VPNKRLVPLLLLLLGYSCLISCRSQLLLLYQQQLWYLLY